MQQDQRWTETHKAIAAFIRKNRRRPSKYNAEERWMVNWLKYNKKIAARGEMPIDRHRRFARLLALCEQYRRVNQSAYAAPATKQDNGQQQLPFAD